MKKYSPVYNQESIIYWPSFAGGVGIICFCGFTLLVYLSCIILFLIDRNIASTTIWVMATTLLLLLVWLVFFLRLAVRSMFCRIKITREDFSIVNAVTGSDIQISWEQVSRIEFKQEGYRGRKQYRVYPKADKQGHYVAIPISMIDEEKLHSMIPAELLSNKPYSV